MRGCLRACFTLTRLDLNQSVIYKLLSKILCFQHENLGDQTNESIFLHDQVQILVLESWQILDLVIFLSQIDKVQMHNIHMFVITQRR